MIELIPASDIIDGKCVRLSQGDYHTKKVYNENPLEVAKEFEAYGIHRLHVVDLDGAASQHVVNYRTLEQIASRTSLIIDFGVGIKTSADIQIAFCGGAEMVTLGSVGVKSHEIIEAWIRPYGSGKVMLGGDVKDNRIAINGWKEESPIDLMPFLNDYIKKGVTKVLCTDINRDGMLEGPALTLYQNIMKAHPELHLIASGGISSLDDILKLDEAGIPAVVFGKALYEGRISLKDLSRYI